MRSSAVTLCNSARAAAARSRLSRKPRTKSPSTSAAGTAWTTRLAPSSTMTAPLAWRDSLVAVVEDDAERLQEAGADVAHRVDVGEGPLPRAGELHLRALEPATGELEPRDLALTGRARAAHAARPALA